MSSANDDALLEFETETFESEAETPPDGLFQQSADTGAVPPPIHNEIDGLVDAISAGGRPRMSSESELVAEANDSVLADAVVVQYAMQRSTPSVFHTAAFRYVAYSIAAFAFGTVVAWSVLRGVDAPGASVAVSQPTAVEPAKTPAPTPISPRAPAPTPPAATPPPTPRPTVAREPAGVVNTAPPAVARREQPAAVAPSNRINATGVVTRPGTAAPIATPNTTAAASRAPVPIAPVAAPPPIDAAPKDGGDVAAVSSPAAPEIIAPPPAAAAPAAASAVRSAIVAEQNAVLETLDEYRQAYQALDVAATAAVWPSVDRRALTRAFSTLRSQQIALNNCAVSIAGATATTHCRGTVEYVRRIGSPAPRTGHQNFVFKMRKLGSEWFIDEVSASESVVARN